MSLIKEIEDTIVSILGTETEVHILDPRQDGVHLEALVISPRFEGLTLLKQQRLVMEGLKGHFDTTLHALALKTFTPEKWALQRAQYGL